MWPHALTSARDSPVSTAWAGTAIKASRSGAGAIVGELEVIDSPGVRGDDD